MLGSGELGQSENLSLEPLWMTLFGRTIAQMGKRRTGFSSDGGRPPLHSILRLRHGWVGRGWRAWKVRSSSAALGYLADRSVVIAGDAPAWIYKWRRKLSGLLLSDQLRGSLSNIPAFQIPNPSPWTKVLQFLNSCVPLLRSLSPQACPKGHLTQGHL